MKSHWIKKNTLYGGSIEDDSEENEKQMITELKKIMEPKPNKEMVKLRKAPPKSIPINTRQLLKSIN